MVTAAEQAIRLYKKLINGIKYSFVPVVPISFIKFESIIMGNIKPAWASIVGWSLCENHIDNRWTQIYLQSG
jgi:hypothetical protein